MGPELNVLVTNSYGSHCVHSNVSPVKQGEKKAATIAAFVVRPFSYLPGSNGLR